jgi:biopolymer transport protein ExbB
MPVRVGMADAFFPSVHVDSTIVETFRTGSASMWIIAACSVVALAVAIERALALWGFARRARALVAAVIGELRRGDLAGARGRCEASRSPAADLLLAGLDVAVPPATPAPARLPAAPERVAAAVDRARQEAALRLRRNLWILGTVGATAPFIGLFGTVVGIMHAFGEMARTGQGGFVVVAAGISEALVATAGGIAVAIEAVVLYNFLNTHVQKLAVQLRLLSEEYVEALVESLPTLRADAPRAVDARVEG